MGGSETYARELGKQLASSDAVSAAVYLPDSARGFGQGLPEHIVTGLPTGGSTIARLRTVAGLSVRAPQMRRAMAAADVVHYPFTVPLPKPSRTQVTVQSLLDVQHLELPHMFSKLELLYRRKFYDGFAKRADAVITISHFAKQRMVELLGISPERIHVAHLGVDTAQFTPNLGERENSVLFPARGWAHKNHATLIAGMEIARQSNPDLRLVLTGGGLEGLGDLPDWVDRRGLVSQEELLRLYRTAGAMVFPSLYEGFGLPPLEAMASGCPVAVSNAGSLPEVVGDAAVLFDPRDPDGIADGIAQALKRGPELAAAGVEHVKKFSWERCLDAHLTAYDAAVKSRA